jgi:hypothetical protein
MDTLEKLATQVIQDKEKQSKTQRNMYWIPLHAAKHGWYEHNILRYLA